LICCLDSSCNSVPALGTAYQQLNRIMRESSELSLNSTLDRAGEQHEAPAQPSLDI
jgi:hypothetical protein